MKLLYTFIDGTVRGVSSEELENLEEKWCVTISDEWDSTPQIEVCLTNRKKSPFNGDSYFTDRLGEAEEIAHYLLWGLTNERK